MADTLPALSEGEKQCLRLVAQGFNSKEIARQLQVSEHTVDQRVRTSLRKFGVPSRKEAARLFVSGYQQPPQFDTYQPLIHQSERLASGPPAAATLAQPDRPDGDRKQGTLLRRLLAFGPPLGGSTNELSADGRILAMIRASILTGVGLVTLLLLISGAFKALG
ncbi:MAG: helix-turn-helix transcriptional regulator [Pseudomonadota bacterium]|uniref:helix-turn-helix transcriptional regulator n=1 Tax=Sphingobium sp. TaxID=1912891 RepID=UPI002E1B1C2B